jgi:hypothetical protein
MQLIKVLSSNNIAYSKKRYRYKFFSCLFFLVAKIQNIRFNNILHFCIANNFFQNILFNDFSTCANKSVFNHVIIKDELYKKIDVI